MNCNKCDTKIPLHIIIDGKRRNLQRRKFCLTCSPFGFHNTRPDISDSPVTVVKQERAYRKWTEKRKARNRKCVTLRGWRLKRRIVNLLGGKCYACGYSDNLAVLTFHHRERKLKSFGLSTTAIRGKPWSLVLQELAKCDLLCKNCHMEEEHRIEASYKHKNNQRTKGARRKQLVVDQLGGGCSMCGYNKLLRCLSFHHRDPQLKSFKLDILTFCSCPEATLQSELSKCDLLCLNCHADLESKLRKSRYLV